MADLVHRWEGRMVGDSDHLLGEFEAALHEDIARWLETKKAPRIGARLNPNKLAKKTAPWWDKACRKALAKV
jgi:hypothetical protein